MCPEVQLYDAQIGHRATIDGDQESKASHSIIVSLMNSLNRLDGTAKKVSPRCRV